MRIEILVGSEDPLIFPINKDRIILGSGENCDIIISSESVSRKHLLIISQDDQYFVADQGSTNGSYINEERLTPGKKIEFTSFFPVRLGEKVLVSLLSDEEVLDEGPEIEPPKESPQIIKPKTVTPEPSRGDSTQVISLHALKKVKTEQLVRERNKKREIKNSKVKKEPVRKKKKVDLFPYLMLLLVGVAGYYNFRHLRSLKEDVVVSESKEVFDKKYPVKPLVNADLVPEEDLPSKESISELLRNLKCATPAEKYLCQLVPGTQEGNFGVTQVGLTLNVMLDGSNYLNEAKTHIQNEDQKLLWKTASLIFLMRDLPLLDEKILENTRLAVAFFTQKDGQFVLEHVLAFYPKVFNREKGRFSEQLLRHIRSHGARALVKFDQAFLVY